MRLYANADGDNEELIDKTRTAADAGLDDPEVADEDLDDDADDDADEDEDDDADDDGE